MNLFFKKIVPQPPAGQGKLFLLLHGFCEDHTIWGPVLSAFREHTVYLADLPGFGLSDAALPRPLSLDWVAEVIYHEIVVKEKIKPIVIGHSLGGYAALALAEKHEETLSGLVLLHSTTLADTDEKKINRNKIIDFVAANGVEAYTMQFVPGLFHSTYRRSHPNQVQQVVELASLTRSDTLTSYAAAMRDRPDRSRILKEFGKAKRVIAGDKDGAVPLEQSLAMKEMAGEQNFVLLEGVAHMGMYEATEEVIRAFSKLV